MLDDLITAKLMWLCLRLRQYRNEDAKKTQKRDTELMDRVTSIVFLLFPTGSGDWVTLHHTVATPLKLTSLASFDVLRNAEAKPLWIQIIVESMSGST